MTDTLIICWQDVVMMLEMLADVELFVEHTCWLWHTCDDWDVTAAEWLWETESEVDGYWRLSEV